MVLAHENNIPTHQKCTSLGDGWDFVSLSPTVVSENVAAEIIKPVVFYLRRGSMERTKLYATKTIRDDFMSEEGDANARYMSCHGRAKQDFCTFFFYLTF